MRLAAAPRSQCSSNRLRSATRELPAAEPALNSWKVSGSGSRRQRVRISAATAAAFLTCAGSAAAQELATSWQDNYNSRIRLVIANAGQPGAPRFIAGVEIKLADGWKTYWRNPGEGGLAPRFDWSASKNLGSAHVL